MSEETESLLASDKTPISNLQEWCLKQGITPQYDLVANEGAVHEPLFVFKVTAGDCICTGKGPSKKKAKHNAAVAALNQLVGVTPSSSLLNQAASGGTHGSVGGSEDCHAGNPVGDLQETTQKRMWPPPVYEFASEQGPPHAREFVCLVRLFDVTEQAVGKSKKQAKRNAAVAMLQLIKQGVVTQKVVEEGADEYDEDNVALPHQNVAFSSEGRNNRIAPQPVERKKTSAMFLPTKSKKGPLIEALQNLSLEAPPSLAQFDSCKRLEEISKEQIFQVTYVDLKAKPSCKLFLCMSELSTVPVTVCYGFGENQSDAHSMAALNTLNYLKVMTRKQ